MRPLLLQRLFSLVAMLPADDLRQPATLTNWLLAFSVSLGPSNMVLASVPDDCRDKLDRAKELFYVEADFDASIKLIEQCLELPDLSRPQKVTAYDLLAQSLIKKRDSSLLERARSAIQNLLELDPTFKPNDDAEPGYRELVEKERAAIVQSQPAEDEPEKDERKTKHMPTERSEGSLFTWLAIGAAAVVAAVVVIVATN